MSQAVNITIDNVLSDTMVANTGWDLAPGSTHMGAGSVDAVPEKVVSMATPVSGNAGLYSSGTGSAAVGGVATYKLPDSSVLVVYFNIRSVGVGVVPNGTPVDDALYQKAAAFPSTYTGKMIVSGVPWDLVAHSIWYDTGDTLTGTVRCNCVKPGLSL